jgi:hypothetical protein
VGVLRTTFPALHSFRSRIAVSNETLLRWLLEHGADPNTVSRRRTGPGSERYTPLIAVVKLSDPSPAKILLSHGAHMDPLTCMASEWAGQASGPPHQL